MNRTSPTHPKLIRLLPLVAALALPAGLAAQAAPSPPPAGAAAEATTGAPQAASAAGATGGSQRSRYEVRSELSQLLMQHREELATILALDPHLLRNQELLAANPEVARFVAAHPEVLANPDFYLGEFGDRRASGGDFAEPLIVGCILLGIGLAMAWLLRTLIEHRRWSRLARTQSEVHNKILDRFGSSEELLAYVRSPAGARFLESAPIPLRADQPVANPSLARVLWSVQVGVVVAAAALGMLLVAGRFDVETARGFFALGTIGLCLGGGFVASAGASIALSRRLGLWAPPPASDRGAGEPSDLVG